MADTKWKPLEWKHVKDHVRGPMDWDWEDITDEEIIPFMTNKAVELVPVIEPTTFENQEKRAVEYPFVALRLAKRLQFTINEQQEQLNRQRAELIEVRKELSQLKRKK